METYGCSREYGWLFKRESFEWEGAPALCPEKLECLFSAGELTIQDCAKSDPPRKKNVLPAQEDGPTAYFLASSAAVVPIYSESGAETDGSHEAGEQKVWAACSALRFEPVDRVEWRAVFHIQERENFHITAVLS